MANSSGVELNSLGSTGSETPLNSKEPISQGGLGRGMGLPNQQPSGTLDPPPEGCIGGFWYGTINYFGLAIAVAVLFAIMISPPIQKFWIRQIPSFWPRLLVQVIVVALIVYIVNRLMIGWRAKYQYCGEPFQVVDVRRT